MVPLATPSFSIGDSTRFAAKSMASGNKSVVQRRLVIITCRVVERHVKWCCT